MEKMRVKVSEELRQKMRKFPDVDWSEVALAAIRKKISELESTA